MSLPHGVPCSAATGQALPFSTTSPLASSLQKYYVYSVCTLCLSHTYTVPRDTSTCVSQNCGLGLGLGFDQCLLLTRPF